ncbi:hypothetical protein [Thioclava kandeliae]|uniref:Uncharacterized protein n=1 Tax=Thioclava kandeliae TaxID=3070818 RepID=A0ABV1SFD8_9RHOB
MGFQAGDFSGRGPLGQKDQSLPKRFSAAERAYFAWLHELPCCVSGRIDIDIAHTGRLSEGKGIGRKAALNTCLPLSKPLHRYEEANREGFWLNVGVDPLPNAQRLWDIYQSGGNLEDADRVIRSMQARADRHFMKQILRAQR